MLKLKFILIFLISSFLLSQDSFNATFVGNWFEPHENYWSEYVSDFNDQFDLDTIQKRFQMVPRL